MSQSIDVVSIGVYAQVKWERDVAMQQLETNGIQFGCKSDVAPVKHGRWIEDGDGDGRHCSECKEDYCYLVCNVERYGYCPHCGAKMDTK